MMDDVDPQTEERVLSSLLDLLRAKGVRRYRAGELEVEFEAPIDTTPEAQPGPEPGLCACGHRQYEHGPGGLCLEGCDAEKCAPKETT